MKTKKAQLQMFETIAVLFVFFILIAIGFIFYGRIMKSNVESEKEEIFQLNSIAIAQKAISLPELQCSDENIISASCIDILKLEAAPSIMSSRQSQYYDMFEFSNITILKIYPNQSQYNLYLRQTSYRSKFKTNIPVSLFNPLTNEYYFGVISIESYSK